MNSIERQLNANSVASGDHSCVIHVCEINGEHNWPLLIIRSFMFFALALMSTISMATVLDDVESTLGDRLPEIADVIPEYNPHANNPVSIAIGDFYTDSDDGVDWGFVVADVIRTDLTGHLDMPARHVRKLDAWTLGMDGDDQMRSDDSLALYHKRYGTRQYVSGQIRVEQGGFNWSVYIRSLPEKNTLQEINISGELSELPDALQKVMSAIVENADASVKVAIKKYDIDTLRAYGNLLNEINAAEKVVTIKRISDAMERHRGFAPMALLYAENYPVPYEYDEIARQQKVFSRLADEYAESAAVVFYLTQNMKPTSGRYSVADKKLASIKRYVSQFPQDSMGLILLVDGLVSEERQLQGLAVVLEALKRWPDNFRLWWDLNWALDSYAWRVRGNTFWKDVPPEGKRLFPVLKEFALEAANEAVSRNADNAKLWNQHMRAIGTYNDDFKNSFMHAIAIAPNYRDAYETAINYAAPKWGGDVKSQYDVLALAQSNNPGERWPEELEKKYIEEDYSNFLWKLESVLSRAFSKILGQ